MATPTTTPALGRPVGPGILSTLTILFVFCKAAGLTAIAAWSWWLVLLPLWILLALTFTVAILVTVQKEAAKR